MTGQGQRGQVRRRSVGRRGAVGRLAAAVATVAAVVLVPAAPGGAAPAGPRFVVPDRTATGGVLPQDVATGDFTNDGRVDVVVAHLGPDAFLGGVAVLPGDGAGNLGNPIRTSVGTQNGTSEVAPGDFDEDGDLDVAVVTGTTGGAGPIRILLGTGTGTFTLGQSIIAGDGHIEAGELTGDGHLDLVFVYEGGAAVVKLFPGLGDGRFGAGVSMSRSWDAYDLELADVDGDGDTDLVGAAGGPIWVMPNLGGGTFGDQLFDMASGLSGMELTLGHFDGDGRLDVAVANGSDGDVLIGKGDGDGTFTRSSTIESVSFGTGWLAAGDWTGDGHLDLVVNNEYATESNIVVLLRGRGDGTFGEATYWTTGNEDMTPVHLDGDGRLDLVAFSVDPGLVYATQNAGGGRFRAPQSIVSTNLGAPERADVDHDGDLDVVLLGVKATTLLNTGGGRFRPVVSALGPSDTSSIRLADLNGDGHLDIVAALAHIGQVPTNVAVMLGDGTGRFGAPVRYGTGDWWASNQSVAVGDVNGDARVDVVGVTTSQLATLLGNGNGTLQPAVLSGIGGSHPGVHLADVTGDGVLDVVVVAKTGGPDFGSGQIRVQRGNGDGTFTSLQTLSFDGNPGAAGVVDDLNGDGRPDVALTAARGSNGGRTGLRVALNTGSALAAPVYYPYPPYPLGDIDAADFDLDGDLDLVGTTLAAFAFVVNDGTGAFPTVNQVIATSSPSRLAGDFTGDGRPDVFSINSTDRGLYSLYVNRR